MSSSVFQSLFTRFPSWTALSDYLVSEEGGSLRVYDRSTPEDPFALVRYVKGKSNLTLPHVRAFRSVVWDTLENRPVSVTPFKSEDGETLPSTDDESTAGYKVERFLDGVMIGAFWDRYNNKWRIHTRSTLDGGSRYYSQTKTFKQMFDEFLNATQFNWDTLDKSSSYTWVLQHPENRVVVPVTRVNATLVQKVNLSNGLVTYDNAASKSLEVLSPLATWTDVRARLADWNTRFKHTVQGLVVKNSDGQRWKIRTSEYSRIRRMRTNTARLDYLWLSLWRSGGLREYLTLYPEERLETDKIVSKWKRITNDVFHIYTDVFKARSLDKKAVHAKYRPFVYGLHGVFVETLKPAGKTVVWKTVLDYMNGRDVAQMLFAINWEMRESMKQMPNIPLEPQVTVGTDVLPTVVWTSPPTQEEDLPDQVPISDTLAMLQQNDAVANAAVPPPQAAVAPIAPPGGSPEN